MANGISSAIVRCLRDDFGVPGSQTAIMDEADRWYLKEWRLKQGLSQEVLAERANTSKGYLSDLERGVRRYNSEYLARFARAMGLESGDLLRPPPENEGDSEEPITEPPSHFARAWREYRGLTTAQLARSMATTEATIDGVEAGEIDLAGKRLDDMAKALATTAGRILTVDPNDVPPEALDAFGQVAPENRPAALAMLRSLAGGKK